MLHKSGWWTGFLMKQTLRKHGKNWEISPPQGGHQECPRLTFHWARGGRPPDAGPTTPRHPQKPQAAHKGPPLWKMMPQSAAWAILKAPMIWGGSTEESKATRQAHQDGTLPTNEPWNHALRRHQPIGNAMMILEPGNRKGLGSACRTPMAFK